MCPGRRLKRTFALLNAIHDRVQVLFSIRGTRRIAPFSTRMRFWRDTSYRIRCVSCLLHLIRSVLCSPRPNAFSLPRTRLPLGWERVGWCGQPLLREVTRQRPETILPPLTSYTRTYVHIHGCHYVHLRQTCATASPAEETISREIGRIGGVARYVRGGN